MKTGLKIGDKVSVHCNNGMTTIHFEAEIIHIRCATGDSWIFRDLRTGLLSHISEGITILEAKQDE